MTRHIPDRYDLSASVALRKPKKWFMGSTLPAWLGGSGNEPPPPPEVRHMAVFMRSAGGGKNKTKRLYSLAQNERRKWYPSTFPTLITIQFVFCFFWFVFGLPREDTDGISPSPHPIRRSTSSSVPSLSRSHSSAVHCMLTCMVYLYLCVRVRVRA